MASEIILGALTAIGLNGLVLKLQDGKINRIEKNKVSKDEFNGFKKLFEERTNHIVGALERIEKRVDFVAQQNGFKK